MALSKKLLQWRNAGLLDAQQVNAILAYESAHAHSRWQQYLAFVGVFAIALGVLAIVAANWWEIPAAIKLLVHLCTNVAVGLLALHYERTQQGLRRELALLCWFGLTLTCIALIGQVFQLESRLAAALLLWCVLTTPALVLLARTHLVLVPLLVAWLLTLIVGYADYLFELFDDKASLPLLLFGMLLPVALAAAAATIRSAERQPLRQLLALTASLLPIVGASLACLFWYGSSNRLPFDSSFVVTLIASALATLARPLAVPAWLPRPAHLRELWWVSLAAIALPFLLPWPESPLLGAISFIALWLHVGYLAHRTGNARLVSFAIVVVTLRVYIIYLEVFGSLAQTGFGLIFSGALLLVLLRFARVLNRNLRPAATPPEAP